MKKTILILTKVVLALSINAQIIALHSSTETQLFKGISALTDAYNTARNGDTLYLSGHTFNAPAIFSKQLIIFGTGHHVDSTLATGKTFINGNIVLQEEADFFYIEGVEITSNFTLQNNTSVNNVIVKRCKINGTFNVLGDLSNPSSNLSLIENVILGRINLENARNAILSNNIIVNTFQSSNGNFINNNIVLGFIWGYSRDDLFNGNNNILNNNIFIWDGYNADAGGVGNVFNNNLYVEDTPNYGNYATASGNYTGVPQSSIFVDQTGTAFNYAHNYHLKDPDTYIGNDGSQVGIYGGTFPWKEGSIPSNPHIQLKIIAPTTDNKGELSIEIQVKAQDN